MLVDIQIITKPELGTKAIFKVEDFKSAKDYKESIAIIFMICADYYLDPEIGIEDLEGFVQQAKSKSMANLALFADEDGIELEFLV
ncbi:MAG: hypothetical protein ACJAS4_003421 [Bacteriovoracaceae bacterium]|jgi:hypothetical protein